MRRVAQRDLFRDCDELIRRVYAYVAYRIGDGPEAEDVTSETFERALRYRASYNPKRGEPIGWMIGIARRCIMDHSFPPNTVNANDQLNEVADDHDLEGIVSERLLIRAAVASLGDRDRELI